VSEERKEKKKVRILNLYNNNIADAGALVLAKALGRCVP
jgi:hypothetical protein